MLKQFAVLVFLLTLVFAAPEEEDNVLVLTKDNFDDTVNKAELILVEFYAPWCGHCKHLAPEYAAAAKELKQQNIPLAKVDCTVETTLAERFGVSGYPTLKVFRHGTPSEYSGPRQKAGIISYMEKQSGPSAKPIDSVEALKKFLEHPDVSVVGFFTVKSGDSYTNFKKSADALRDDFRFAEVTDPAVLKEYGFSSANAIVMFTKEKGAEKKVYTGASNQAELSDWIFAKSLPLVGEITPDNAKRYEKRGVPIVKLFFDVDFGSNIKRTNYYINRLRKAAEGEAQTKLSFAVAKRSSYKDQMTTFGVENKEVSLVIDDFKGSLKYRSEEEVSQESMKKFVADYLAGKLEPYIKSLPPPEKQEGPVTVVVGKTFNNIVMDPTKDVMIELYAPWCGHCKNLEPIYNQLAEKIQKEGVSNVVIAKMDATVNDSPVGTIQAKGYPTIFFVPANKKDAPIQYSGAREVKDMYDFIKKNSASWKKDEL